MATATDLHIFRVDMEITSLPKIFAECSVEWAIARCIVGTICTYMMHPKH
jgi:hypothetical protein